MTALEFDNSFVRELPGDPEQENYRRQVSHACYSKVQPKSVRAPQLVAYSQDLAQDLGLSATDFQSDEFLQALSGNALLPGMEPFAMCYGGHQFGNWAGQLGDGRAINLGEVLSPRAGRQMLQLKGAGPTPYSRTADGLAVLRSSVREFLCSEAMHYLGVPTTRALSLVTTGEQVMRDMFYDGRPRLEPGAIVCRVAPSFIRFGNFEILAARRDTETLKKLVDYTLRTHFPEFVSKSDADAKESYLAWFKEVCRRTVDMIVHWMRVGFVHGVMNTDNMSIHGLTIDYGPYGWLEDYDPHWTPNTTDAEGRRYRFSNQPGVAQWNLLQLANAIFHLVEDADALQQSLHEFAEQYTLLFHGMMARKLGFAAFHPATDGELIEELELILPLVETDMTLFYRALPDVDTKAGSEKSDEELIAPLQHCFYLPTQLTPDYVSRLGAWLREYGARVERDGVAPSDRRQAMNQVNPKYVLRNYLAQLAIDKAEQGDFSMVRELLEVLKRPYDEQSEFEVYGEKRPDWARHRPGCSMLSCSS